MAHIVPGSQTRPHRKKFFRLWIYGRGEIGDVFVSKAFDGSFDNFSKVNGVARLAPLFVIEMAMVGRKEEGLSASAPFTLVLLIMVHVIFSDSDILMHRQGLP